MSFKMFLSCLGSGWMQDTQKFLVFRALLLELRGLYDHVSAPLSHSFLVY